MSLQDKFCKMSETLFRIFHYLCDKSRRNTTLAVRNAEATSIFSFAYSYLRLEYYL